MAVIYRSDVALSASAAPRVVRRLANRNVARYYSASRASGSDGSSVSELAISGGTADVWTAPSAGSSPTLAVDRDLHMPYLSFDGVNDRMDAPASVDQPLTALVIARFPVLPSVPTVAVNFHTQPGGRGIEVASDGSLSTLFPTKVALGTTVDTDWHVYTLQVNGSSGFVQIDGGARVTGNFGTGSAGGITVGRNATGTGFTQIDVAEVVVWANALNSIALNKEYRSIKAFYGWEF